ncbi:putative F-box/LRR-repeat protein At5g02930 [Silene latifolia]|uniref:putative F-box/LRR-repeat protein At5g02930 n=1 Tax=Silene latifolia TaxID=37657 RepID=UPI003D784978
MTSVDSKTSGVIQNLDRISELPEPMILNILSCLPLEDSARASILSKTWKSFCSLNPILYYDHNLFALQSMVGGDEPDINQIRDMFLDDVHHHLSRARQLDSPIRKLALKVAINDSNCFSRLDKCLELLRHINVQDLCVIVQTVGYFWKDLFCDEDDIYEFPISVLASKGLRSVSIRGCMFAKEAFVGDPINKRPGVSFSSLQRLCLSHVYIKDHAFDNLVTYCPGVEILVIDSCSVLMDSLELSRFPKLKNALIEFQLGRINHIGIADTNLECFKCTINIGTECHISPAACASIRELTLLGCTLNQPSLFADFAATFPLVEEADIFIHDTETFKAVSNVLRKLKFSRYGSVPLKEVHVDCPRLTSLDCFSYGLVKVYVDCPKLRVFHFRGSTVPKRLFFSPVADLEESRFKISVNYAYDTLWFINLRAFLVLAMASPTYVFLTFALPMATFEPEQVEAFHASPQYNIHLTVWVTPEVGENVTALVDAMLWVIRPTTLVVGCGFYHLLKYLCENLMKKAEVNICDEQVPESYPCWMHHLKDFQAESDFKIESSLDIPDIKENLVDLADQCRTFSNHIYFTFRWSN